VDDWAASCPPSTGFPPRQEVDEEHWQQTPAWRSAQNKTACMEANPPKRRHHTFQKIVSRSLRSPTLADDSHKLNSLLSRLGRGLLVRVLWAREPSLLWSQSVVLLCVQELG